MARTAKITINGVTYTLCFSTRVMADLEDAYDATFQDVMDRVSARTKDRVALLAALMRAGYIYDKNEGLDPPQPLSEDEIMDSTMWGDKNMIFDGIMDAMKAGNSRKVEARPKSKKANGATQAE